MSGNGAQIRVLVVDDSAFMRRVLGNIIGTDPQMTVVGVASDGREAVSQAESLHPDVITMDINMPVMDGLEATEHIMTRNPRPIVVVSSETRQGANGTLRALELGAVDFVAKPSAAVDLDMGTVREDLLKKIRMASKVRVVRTASRTKVSMDPAGTGKTVIHPAPQISFLPALQASDRFPVIVVAASTGGPATVMQILPRLPKGFPAAILLVQHMPAAFTAQYGQQLAERAGMKVKEAAHQEAIEPATIYVCPGSHHLRISPLGRMQLDDGPRISGYRPCADVTMETAAVFAGPMAMGVVLTGMGGDAAQGARAIKRCGGFVIAQDEATSTIFGMPAEAIKAGAVDRVLPADEICAGIERRVLEVLGPPRRVKV
ncbi:MAG TPA: chemotaxis response regulator protein-glutamate methylesterase [Candidatus Acidoferrales bacterium]|nr:chemotaxis response regulator protein-glutamate methylesterase [Candidatus Acidoferrales bacterium]